MNGTIEEAKKADRSDPQPSTAWNTLREFLLYTVILSGGFALLDLYRHGQSIREYILHGVFIGAFIVLGKLIGVRWQRSLNSETNLPRGK